MSIGRDKSGTLSGGQVSYALDSFACQQRFHHTVDVLRGANTQRICDLGHDQLTTYGTGKDLSTDEMSCFQIVVCGQWHNNGLKAGHSLLKFLELEVAS